MDLLPLLHVRLAVLVHSSLVPLLLHSFSFFSFSFVLLFNYCSILLFQRLFRVFFFLRALFDFTVVVRRTESMTSWYVRNKGQL